MFYSGIRPIQDREQLKSEGGSATVQSEIDMQLESAARALLEKYSDRDVIVVSREITRQLHLDLSRAVQAQKRHDKCTLIVTTFGGDAHAAYRISRCLRHHYEHVRVVIPSICKSAGTLIAIIADELAIGDLGELGPLDIQVRKDSELGERGSGLDIIQALQVTQQHALDAFRSTLYRIRLSSRLSTKVVGDFAAKVAVGVAAPLYAQIDPIRLGEMQRAMRIAHEYGLRLQLYTNSLKDEALDRLVVGYPSHNFVIDRKEAAELFNTVQPPSPEEASFCNTLWDILETEREFGPEFVVLPTVEVNGESHEKAPTAPPREGNGGGEAEGGNIIRDAATATDGPSRQIRQTRPRKAKSAKTQKLS